MGTSTIDTIDWFDGEYSAIPEYMRAALVRYVVERIQPGSFLTAVICNDLRTAVNNADDENLPLLKTYVRWFYNIAPAVCHGNYGTMRNWLEQKPVKA
ncbi:MAG: hypothetical protein EBV03_13785 [Proteobacteria bacterium]|nr:hypothetical protein [Pseudomonadota bacterium]